MVSNEMEQRLSTITDTVLPDGKEWYYEKSVGSNILTITVGDSWTWGDSLGKTTASFDDREHRVNHIYGNLLAIRLNSDFINIGVPGGSNLLILDYLKKVLDNLTKSYDKTYIVFTLTESGRELSNNLLDQETHYNKWAGESWPTFDALINQKATSEQLKVVFNDTDGTHFKHVIGLYLAIAPSTSLIDLLDRYEEYTVKCIREYAPNVILARNFTNFVNQHRADIKQRWVDIISIKGILETYPDHLYVMSQIGIDPLLKFTKNKYKNQWVDLLDTAIKGVDWLSKSPYNSNRATKHPLEQAHQWWAQHLFESIKP